MNQHKTVLKAAQLVRPLVGAVQARRPSGMSNANADRVAGLLARAADALEEAVSIYAQVAERREKWTVSQATPPRPPRLTT